MNARRGVAAAGVAGLLALGLAGCVVTAPAPASMPMMSGTSRGPAVGNGEASGGDGTAPSTGHTGPIAGEGLDATAVAELQAAVDRGSQPWRLDRRTVAEAFARARLGMMMPTATDSGGTVDVTDGRGGEASLTLAQPGRTGTDGVWVVTAGSWLT